MKDDEARWDERYRTKTFPDDADELVKRFSDLAKTGRALDIGAGNGRNALFLAEKGFQVDAIEISGVAVDLIRARSPKINCLQKDLDAYHPQPDSYNLIININYLNRRLFPHIRRALRKDGILIFRTFLDSHFQWGPQPNSNRDHYLQSNELLHTCLSLQVLYYEEKETVWANGELREEARLVARKSGRSD